MGDASWPNLNFEFSRPGAGGRDRPEPEAPFRIVVVGDFSGRDSRDERGSSDEIAARRIRAVDIDTIDERIAGADVRVRVGDAPATFDVTIRELDDLHPDALHDHLDVFKGLRDMRRRLADPASFAAAAAEMNAWSDVAPAPEPAAPAEPDDEFAAILGRGGRGPAPSAAARTAGIDLQSILRHIVGPHVVPATDPRQAELVAVVEQVIGDEMRRVLHDPAFRAVERAWRAVHRLVTSLETDETLQIHLVDVGRREMIADLLGHEDLAATGLARLLVDRSVHAPGVAPWCLIVSLHDLDASRGHAILGARLAQVGAAAGAPVVAGASPALAGCPSLVDHPDAREWTAEIDPAWASVRALPDASSLCLVAPRFLLRQPYGPSDPISRFDFEETSTPPRHDDLPWASGALIVAEMVARSFSDRGWDLPTAFGGEVGGLPVHAWKRHGEREVTPSAEAWLSDRAGQHLLDAGLTPLLSVRGRDSVLVPGVRSFASTDGPPAWRWG